MLSYLSGVWFRFLEVLFKSWFKADCSALLAKPNVIGINTSMIAMLLPLKFSRFQPVNKHPSANSIAILVEARVNAKISLLLRKRCESIGEEDFLLNSGFRNCICNSKYFAF
jgi:hypothetical protein